LREARVWGVRAELLPRAVRRVQPAALEAALLHAARADRLIKGLGRGDMWDELLQVALRLMPDGAPDRVQSNRGRISASR
jgi:DNA polymerase-3 subunit delta